MYKVWLFGVILALGPLISASSALAASDNAAAASTPQPASLAPADLRPATEIAKSKPAGSPSGESEHAMREKAKTLATSPAKAAKAMLQAAKHDAPASSGKPSVVKAHGKRCTCHSSRGAFRPRLLRHCRRCA